jgi:hypothetical protein
MFIVEFYRNSVCSEEVRWGQRSDGSRDRDTEDSKSRARRVQIQGRQEDKFRGEKETDSGAMRRQIQERGGCRFRGARRVQFQGRGGYRFRGEEQTDEEESDTGARMMQNSGAKRRQIRGREYADSDVRSMQIQGRRGCRFWEKEDADSGTGGYRFRGEENQIQG